MTDENKIYTTNKDEQEVGVRHTANKRFQSREQEISALARASAEPIVMMASSPDASKIAKTIVEACDVCRIQTDEGPQQLMIWSPDDYCYTNIENRLMYLIVTIIDSEVPMVKSTKSLRSLYADVVDALKSDAKFYSQRIRTFNEPRDKGLSLIPLTDGVYDSKNDKYLSNEEAKQYDFTYRLNFKRNQSFDAVHKQIIDRLFNDWSGNNAEKRQVLLDYMRCVIENDNRGRGLLIYAPGGNGKSSYLKCVASLIPKSAAVWMNMHEFDNQFMHAKLTSGTNVILGDELNTSFSFEGRAMSALKQLLSGAPISINPKGQAPYVLSLHACIIQAMNTPLIFRESNTANKDRWIYYIWPNINFRALKRAGEIDFDLEQLISDSKFAESLFNYVLSETKWFKEFHVPASVEIDTENVIESNDSILQFVDYLQEQRVIGYDALIPTSVAYEMYITWLRDENRSAKPMSRRKFTNRMTDELSKLGYHVQKQEHASSDKSALVRLSTIDMLKWDRQNAQLLTGQEYADSNFLKSQARTAFWLNENFLLETNHLDEIQRMILDEQQTDLSNQDVQKVINYLIHDMHDVLVASKYANSNDLY